MIHKILKIDLSDDKMLKALEEFLSKVGEENTKFEKEPKKEEKKDYSALLNIDHLVYSVDDITKKDAIKVLVKRIKSDYSTCDCDIPTIVNTLKILNKVNPASFSFYLLNIIATLYFGVEGCNSSDTIFIVKPDYTITNSNSIEEASAYPVFKSKESAIKAIKLFGKDYVEK